MSATVIADLIERVGRAEGPDREIDGLLWWLAHRDTLRGADSARAERSGVFAAMDYIWFGSWRNPPEGTVRVPSYTASIDAALALVERVLPGCQWTIEPDGCWLRWMTGDAVRTAQGGFSGRSGKATCLAILAALLTALSEGGSHAEPR